MFTFSVSLAFSFSLSSYYFYFSLLSSENVQLANSPYVNWSRFRDKNLHMESGQQRCEMHSCRSTENSLQKNVKRIFLFESSTHGLNVSENNEKSQLLNWIYDTSPHKLEMIGLYFGRFMERWTKTMFGVTLCWLQYAAHKYDYCVYVDFDFFSSSLHLQSIRWFGCSAQIATALFLYFKFKIAATGTHKHPAIFGRNFGIIYGFIICR